MKRSRCRKCRESSVHVSDEVLLAMIASGSATASIRLYRSIFSGTDSGAFS